MFYIISFLTFAQLLVVRTESWKAQIRFSCFVVTEKQLDFYNFSPTPNTMFSKSLWLSGLYKNPCPRRGHNFKGITSRNNTQADRCLSSNTCGFSVKKQLWPSRKGNICELHGPAASIYYTLLFPFPTENSINLVC